MSKRREQEQAPEDIGRILGRVYAGLYSNVPWLAVAAICLYLPGIVLWAVFALRCKADTFIFLTTIAPVAPETVDGVSNLVNTTLIALITTATFIFMLALVLAIARSIQKAGLAPHSFIPCARPTPSSFYLYRVFNLGYNFIVFFVNMFIIFLMMGAFLWLVVAYGANLSIKGGVLDAAVNGFRPQLQYDLARQNYTTVVSYYEQQLKLTPACVRNTSWFRGINSSIAGILKPAADDSPGNTVLCPQSCLNLGSWATLFKLKSNCMCEQEKLYLLQAYSMAVATDAGVALGGLILIYFGSCFMHAYLISEHTHAGYDYRKAKRHQSRRQHALGSSANSSDNRHGNDKGSGGGGGNGGSVSDGGNGHDHKHGPGSAGHHVIPMNGSLQDGFDPHTGGPLPYGSSQQHSHQRSGSGSSAYESVVRVVPDSRGGSFSIVEEGREADVGTGGVALSPTAGMAVAAGAAGALAAASAAAAAAAGHGLHAVHSPGPGHDGAAAADVSPFAVSAGGLAAAGAGHQALLSSEPLLQQRLQLQQQQRHHRVSSGGGSGSSPVSASSRHLQRIPSPHNATRAAAGAGLLAHTSSIGSTGYHQEGTAGFRAPGTGSRVGDWQQQQLLAQQQQQQQQQQLMGHDHVRAVSPPAIVVSGMWSSHGRSESRSSTSSIRDLLSGAVPLDNYGHHHHHRPGLTPTSSGNAAAAMAAAAAAAAGVAAAPRPVAITAPTAAAPVALATVPAASAAAATEEAVSSTPSRATHRRGDSQQSTSSSSSYNTVVCHSPRSDPEAAASAMEGQSVLQAGAAAVPAAFLSTGTSNGRRAPQQQQQQASAASAAAADDDEAAVPAAAAAAMDGEEALSGSRTGSWSRKQAHRRLPALDFTKAAPALWLAQEGEQQQQMVVEPPSAEQQQQQQHVEATQAPAAAAAGALQGVCRAPVRRHITLDGSPSADLNLTGMLEQQQQAAPGAAGSGYGQQQPQQRQLQQQLPSITAVAAMLAPSPEPDEQQPQQGNAVLQQQQQEQQLRSPSAEPGLEPQQQQRVRQRPPYSLLLPPPEQQELLVKQQQQQLQLLLQQAQEEQAEQQQQQLQPWGPHHRQWSTPSLSLAAAGGGIAAGSPGGLLFRQQQQQQQLHHHHSFSLPDSAAAAAVPQTMAMGPVTTPSSQYGAGIVGAGAAAGAFGGSSTPVRLATPGSVRGSATMAIPPQQQQQAGLASSYGSSSGGGAVRFAAPGSTSVNGDSNSSPGEAGGAIAGQGYAATGAAAAAAAAGVGAYGLASSSAAGGSVPSSVFSTPQPTPQSSPAPPRPSSGRVTPSYGLHAASSSGSSSWSQLPPLGPGSSLTTSSSYSGSANHPSFAGGLNNLLLPGSMGAPNTSLLTPLGGESALASGPGSGFGGMPSPGLGLLNPSSGSGGQGLGMPAIPPIPEITPGESSEGELAYGPLEGGSSAAAAAAMAGGARAQQQHHQDVVLGSPLERRRSGGYRSSLRKGLMAYDQYKHRQRYQEALTQPLDPGSEVARRYRSRVPAM